jgi:acyl transferase domain-containing protein
MSSPKTPVRDTDTSTRQPAPHWIAIKDRLEAAVSAPQFGTLLGEHVKIDTTPPVHLWQAWLNPEAKPYLGFQRIQGAEVVPVSVLLQTLSTAASECGASALSDVRFEHPFVVDQPRVIQVVADGESVTVSSSSAPPADHWSGHARARISQMLQDEPGDTANSADQEMAGDDASSVTEPQRTGGIEGQPFAWSIQSCRSMPDAFHADVDLPEALTVALLDAAIHVGRLVDGSGPLLMFPVAAESVRLHTGFADSRATVKVRRRGGNGDELIVDIVVTAPGGSRCVDIRSLRYAALDSGLAQVGSDDESPLVAWSQIPVENRVTELEIRLQAIIAHELGMPASAVDVYRAFPELGLDSTMAMAVLREANKLVGFEVSATMLWDHPTTSSLAMYLAELLAPQQVPQENSADLTLDSASSVLDELFDHVESASAGE